MKKEQATLPQAEVISKVKDALKHFKLELSSAEFDIDDSLTKLMLVLDELLEAESDYNSKLVHHDKLNYLFDFWFSQLPDEISGKPLTLQIILLRLLTQNTIRISFVHV